MSEGEKVSVEILKPMINELLTTLDFLYTEVRVVHTGKFSKNSAENLSLTPFQIFKKATS
jgi:hypothetical protein